jgi:hypothetical protein
VLFTGPALCGDATKNCRDLEDAMRDRTYSYEASFGTALPELKGVFIETLKGGVRVKRHFANVGSSSNTGTISSVSLNAQNAKVEDAILRLTADKRMLTLRSGRLKKRQRIPMARIVRVLHGKNASGFYGKKARARTA